MDDIFPVEWHSDLFWFETTTTATTTPTPASSFVPYNSYSSRNYGDVNNSGNFQKKMIEFLRKKWREKRDAEAEEDLEREKGRRHMINERIRREKQKQSYLALHTMLPIGTKSDKNSVVQMATRTIQELKTYEAMLERRKLELEMKLIEKREKENGTVIKLRVANPSCGINSMLAVLNFLENVGVNARAIHTTFSDTEFSAQLVIDTEMGAAEVERALQVTLSGVERKLRGRSRLTQETILKPRKFYYGWVHPH